MRSLIATSKRRPGRRRRRALIAVACIVALVALVIVIDSALYYGKAHAGVSIAGRSVGGLTHDEATALLTRMAKDAENVAVTLTSGGKTWKVTAADVGVEVDVGEAVETAMDVSRKSNFLVGLGRRLALYFSGTDIPLQGSVDPASMDEVIDNVARDLDIPPVDAGLAIKGSDITVVEGQKGLMVDEPALRERLRTLLLGFQTADLPIPMTVREPAVRADDYQEALSMAKRMISSTVTLRTGDLTWELTPEQIAAYMDYASEDRNGVPTLVAYMSADKMSPFLKELAADVDVEPIDATFQVDNERAWVVPGVVGKAVDPVGTAEALTAAALKTSARTTTVVLTTLQPDLTTEEARDMGIEVNLGGGYTTKWEGTEDRQVNVRITTQYASDVILAPGDVYDFDKQIGPRAEERGYRLAPGITAGELEDVLGGGICQVSTTLFNAAFFAGLEILERKNHSIFIDHYPRGRDATVSADGPNMRFRNDTGHYILIRGTSNGITTTFNIYGTDDGRTVSYTTSEFFDEVEMATYKIPASWLGPGTTFVKVTGQPGRSIEVARVVKAKDGSVIHKDVFKSTWKMVTREVEVGTGSTTTTRSTSTTGTTAPPASSTRTTKPASSTTGP